MKLFNKDEFLANELRLYFVKNKVKEGDKLPSERELCDKYGVQRGTVRSAYDILEEEGIIEIRERSGRYMAHPRVPTDLQRIKSFTEKTNEIGINIENKLLSFELIEIDKKLSQKIKLPIGTTVYNIKRIRKIISNGKAIPIIIEYSYIPESKAQKLIQYNLEERSLFEILCHEYGCIPEREEQTIDIVYANEFEAKILQVDKMTALVRKSGTTYDQKGEMMQYINAIMNKKWVSFEENNEEINKRIEEGLYGL